MNEIGHGKPNLNASIGFQEIEEQEVSESLHSHSSFELVFVIQGSGQLQIGEQIAPFGRRSVFLIPPKLLHKWQSDSGNGVSALASYIALHFSPEYLPSKLLNLPELGEVSRMFSESRNGIKSKVADPERLRGRLRSIHRAKGTLRLARFYVALELIAGFERTQISEKQQLNNKRSSSALARLEASKRFISDRFLSGIARSEVAREVGMDEAAFSRFFHEASGTTYVDYVVNLRVRHAATLLGNRRDLTVPEVAKSSGFSNLSAFHRQFKKRLGTTPNAYRKAANSEILAP